MIEHVNTTSYGLWLLPKQL